LSSRRSWETAEEVFQRDIRGSSRLPLRQSLQTLFRRYARLVIEGEFRSAYSGARTLLALPVRADGRVDAYTIQGWSNTASRAKRASEPDVQSPPNWWWMMSKAMRGRFCESNVRSTPPSPR